MHLRKQLVNSSCLTILSTFCNEVEELVITRHSWPEPTLPLEFGQEDRNGHGKPDGSVAYNLDDESPPIPKVLADKFADAFCTLSFLGHSLRSGIG